MYILEIASHAPRIIFGTEITPHENSVLKLPSWSALITSILLLLVESTQTDGCQTNSLPDSIMVSVRQNGELNAPAA